MRIIGWNLNHRTLAKPIPAQAIAAIRALKPDVLVITEYVDGDGRPDFKEALRDIGLPWISVSEKRDRHNQVLIASELEHGAGDVTAPTESHGCTNFLAVTFREPAFTLIGARAPAYEAASQVRSYWEEMTGILGTISARRVLLVGDLNGDPELSSSVGGSYLKRLRDSGWTLPAPSGAWSYVSSDGRHSSRIDHVLASAAVEGVTASYITEVDGTIVAGPMDTQPISDHAIISCEVELGDLAPRSEVILSVGAEGGRITLYGVRTAKGWAYSRDVMDQTPELLDEPWIEHSSDVVDNWQAALELLDRYPWHMLYPDQVHKEFRTAVLEAVKARYPEDGSSSRSRLPEWTALCKSPEPSPLGASKR